MRHVKLKRLKSKIMKRLGTSGVRSRVSRSRNGNKMLGNVTRLRKVDTYTEPTNRNARCSKPEQEQVLTMISQNWSREVTAQEAWICPFSKGPMMRRGAATLMANLLHTSARTNIRITISLRVNASCNNRVTNDFSWHLRQLRFRTKLARTSNVFRDSLPEPSGMPKKSVSTSKCSTAK